MDSSGRGIGPSQSLLPDNTQDSQQIDIHAPSGIRTRNPTKRAAADPRLRPNSYILYPYFFIPTFVRVIFSPIYVTVWQIFAPLNYFLCPRCVILRRTFGVADGYRDFDINISHVKASFHFITHRLSRANNIYIYGRSVMRCSVWRLVSY